MFTRGFGEKFYSEKYVSRLLKDLKLASRHSGLRYSTESRRYR